MRAEESKKPDKSRYKTTNWREYNKALKARGSLTVWQDKDMQWFASPTGKRGRRPTFSDAAIHFCLSIKCLFGLALRQALGFVHSLLRLAGLPWPVPHLSWSSFFRQKDRKFVDQTQAGLSVEIFAACWLSNSLGAT